MYVVNDIIYLFTGVDHRRPYLSKTNNWKADLGHTPINLEGILLSTKLDKLYINLKLRIWTIYICRKPNYFSSTLLYSIHGFCDDAHVHVPYTSEDKSDTFCDHWH